MRSEFVRDDRAIEGLPVRLVIAVTVGVATLGIMMTILDGVDGTQEPETTVELGDELLVVDDTVSVSIAVVTEDGHPVEDAQLLVTAGSLPVENGPVDLQTGPDSNEATLTVGTDSRADALVSFRDGQRRGTLEIEVVPPSGSGFEDRRSNPELVVVDD
jgi:hypothetical protein